MALSPSNRPKLVPNLDSPRSKPVLHIVGWCDWMIGFEECETVMLNWPVAFLLTCPFAAYIRLLQVTAIAARSVFSSIFMSWVLCRRTPTSFLPNSGIEPTPCDHYHLLRSIQWFTHLATEPMQLVNIRNCIACKRVVGGFSERSNVSFNSNYYELFDIFLTQTNTRQTCPVAKPHLRFSPLISYVPKTLASSRVWCRHKASSASCKEGRAYPLWGCLLASFRWLKPAQICKVELTGSKGWIPVVWSSHH